MDEKLMISTSEAAKLLGISRVAMFKKIKVGHIRAAKIGRGYFIDRAQFSQILGEAVGDKQKMILDRAVEKTIKEYGQTLKLLGQE